MQCQSQIFIFTLGLSLNCLQCGNWENFEETGYFTEGCQENEEGTSVLCPEGSNSCIKHTCDLFNTDTTLIFKGCADSFYPDCFPEVNISISIYYFYKNGRALALNQ